MEDCWLKMGGGGASSPSQVNYSTVSFIWRRGQSDGQPRCTKQREKETEEKGSQADISTGEARDSLQANAAGPDAPYRTDKAIERRNWRLRLLFSGRFLGAYAGDWGFMLDAAVRLLMRGTAVQ